MKSPKSSALSESRPLKQFPASARAALQTKHKVKKNVSIISSDERLQSTDARRKYMRRGSKTPAMLLIEANRDLDTLGKSLFPTLCEQYSDLRNTSYQALNSKALALATAIDTFSDSYMISCRVRRKSNSWINCDITAPYSTPPDVVPTDKAMDEFSATILHSMRHAKSRRLSAMTELKEHLDRASIFK